MNLVSDLKQVLDLELFTMPYLDPSEVLFTIFLKELWSFPLCGKEKNFSNVYFVYETENLILNY